MLSCSPSLACVFRLLTFADFGIIIFMMPLCIVCSAYALLPIYAFTIVTKTCLPPANRHTAACVSWRPHPTPLVSLSSQFQYSVPSVSHSCITCFRRRDWKRESWHRETITIVGTDIARLDNAAPYRKGGHRESGQRGARLNRSQRVQHPSAQ